MIDGVTSGINGWAIFRNNGLPDQTQSETALFTLLTPVTAGAKSFTLTIYQNYGTGANSFHVLGDFSLAYTTAAAPTLASAATAMTIVSASAQQWRHVQQFSTGPVAGRWRSAGHRRLHDHGDRQLGHADHRHLLECHQ